MSKKLHWLILNHLFWPDFDQLDCCLWKQLICTKFQRFWENWPSSFGPYAHVFMMILNIMGHLPLTEHIKAYSICFQLLGQQFEFSVFCFNSLAYGIVSELLTWLFLVQFFFSMWISATIRKLIFGLVRIVWCAVAMVILVKLIFWLL